MSIYNLILNFIIVELFLARFSEPLSSLRLVHVIYRHGDVTPMRNGYPNDPYINSTYYPFGNGQLNNEGKRTIYHLGKLLRKRYGDFLGSVYQPDLLQARTTNTDRGKMSTQLILASLFPPTGSLVWNPDLNWMPIPFESLTTLDKVLSSRFCPNFKLELKRVYETDVYKNTSKRYRDLFQYISEKSGKNFTDVFGAFFLYNVLFVRKNVGQKLPKWTETVFPEPLKTIAIMRFDLFGATLNLQRILTGFFLQKIVDDTRGKLTNQTDKKLFLYSDHKTKIGAILKTLNIFDPQIPPYGSYVAFEVHNINETIYMKILYENYTMVNPYEMTLPSCDTYCEFDKFVENIQKYFPEDNECGD